MNEGSILIAGLLAFLYAALLIYGVTLHDMRQVLSRTKQKQRPHARRYRQRPKVTALLYLDHNLDSVEQALSNLLAGRYRKLDIVLIVPPQLFAAAQVRASRIKSRRSVYIHSSRHTQLSVAARQAYHRFGSGDLVAIFDDQRLPTARFIPKAVEHFNRYPDTLAVCAHRLTTSSYSVVGLFQTYEDFIHSLRQKAFSGLGLLPVKDRLGGSVYRQWGFLNFPLNQSLKDNSTHYASELTVLSPAPASLNLLLQNQLKQQGESLRSLWLHRLHPSLIKRMISLVLLLARGIIVLLTPIVVGYCLFMAIWLYQPLFLSIVTLLYAGVLLFAIIGNEALRPVQKVLYIGLIPITPIAAFLLSLLQTGNILWRLIQLQPVARLLHKRV